jgi:putative phosphoesterase
MISANTQILFGVLSDTHDQLHNLLKAINFFNKKHVKLVIHCGDWISPFTLKHYTKLNAPIYGVFGNNDGDKLRHIWYAKKYGLNVTYEDQFLTLSEQERRIAVYHGDYQEIVESLIKCRDYDVVFHGHNHCPEVRKYADVVSLNPGTLVDFTNDAIKEASFGIYDVKNHEGEIIFLKDIE